MSASLEHERDELLARLRDLDEEHDAGAIDDADYENLRDDYTARAADVLRRLENPDAPPPPVAAAEVPGARPRQARLRVVAALLVVALIAGGSGFALARSADERSATDEATGSLPEGSIDRITRAQMLVSDGKVLEAVRVYDSLLKDDPENPVALAQRGWLLSRVDPSLVDSGLASIDRAIAVEPAYADAHFFRAMILWRAKREPAMAVESFQRALDARPPADVAATIEELKAQAAAEAAGGTTTP